MSKLYVCPHCKAGRYDKCSVISFTCGSCGKYFNVKDCLDESEVEHVNLPRRSTVSDAERNLRDNAYKRAHTFKENSQGTSYYNMLEKGGGMKND